MLLGIDLGTTHIKTLVADRDGRVRGRGLRRVSLLNLDDAGVEQDIEEIWAGTLAAVREALAPVDPAAIEAIGLSAQGGALQLLDERGGPRGRVISWLDGRGAPFDAELTRELGREWFLERVGHAGSWLAVGQLGRLLREDPKCLRVPQRVGFVGDVIGERLTGRWAQERTSAALTLLYDPRLKDYNPELLRLVGIERGQLPAVVSARDGAGKLLGRVANETGMRAGIPVSAAVHDQYASVLAAGVMQAGEVMMGTGTAWVLLAVSDHWPEPATDQALVGPHLEEGLWGQILSLVNGGSALRWVLELTGAGEADPAAIDAMLESVPAGCAGLECWPFLASSEVAGLAGQVRGGFAGVQLGHRREHLARAVVEGLAYEVNRHVRMLEATGTRIESLAITGGAARSQNTMQILADVTGCRLSRRQGTDEAALGAAIVARGLTETSVPLSVLAEEMAGEPEMVLPGAQQSVYEGLFKRYLESLSPHGGQRR